MQDSSAQFLENATLNALEFSVILADWVPSGFQTQYFLLIHIPKGFSSKKTLDVAPWGLDIATVKVWRYII